MNPQNQANKNISFILIISFLSLIIIGAGIYLYDEIIQAKNYCESINGNYSLSFIHNSHFCNSIPIYKTKEGWGFDRDIKNIKINLSAISK